MKLLVNFLYLLLSYIGMYEIFKDFFKFNKFKAYLLTGLIIFYIILLILQELIYNWFCHNYRFLFREHYFCKIINILYGIFNFIISPVMMSFEFLSNRLILGQFTAFIIAILVFIGLVAYIYFISCITYYIYNSFRK